MKILVVLLLAALGLTGCIRSKQSRQERAYAKYIQKSSAGRQKQRARFKSDKPQMPITPMPSEPVESTSSGPEAATSTQPDQ